MVQLTRSAYQLIADTIREYQPAGLPMPARVLAVYRLQLAEHFADALAQTNPRFDRTRFIAASTGGN